MSPDSKEILHNSVYRCEPLHMGGRREASHLALPLTRGLVGDLGSIVRVLISDVDHRRHHGAARGGVGAQLVGDQPARDTALGFQQFPKESDGCSPIPVRLHEDVQDVTVLVYSRHRYWRRAWISTNSAREACQVSPQPDRPLAADAGHVDGPNRWHHCRIVS